MEQMPDKFWPCIKWHFWELVKTFSGEPSFYSSKRIERMLIFVNANISLDLIIGWLTKHDKLDYMGAIGIYVAQMAYAGYQTKQISKDDKPDQPQ